MHGFLAKFCKIQGDGRKFLERFRSYFGSQISSQSLNEIPIYRLQPKSATKGGLFFVLFCFCLFVFCLFLFCLFVVVVLCVCVLCVFVSSQRMLPAFDV